MNKKNFIIIVFIFVIVIIGLSLMFYLNDNNPMEVEATVKLVGNNYIIVEDGNGKE